LECDIGFAAAGMRGSVRSGRAGLSFRKGPEMASYRGQQRNDPLRGNGC